MVMSDNFYKEAWEVIKKYLYSDTSLTNDINDLSLISSIDMIESLVSRGNHGRPIQISVNGYIAFRCPCCNEIIPFGAEGMRYCGHCSAKLEWLGLDIKNRVDKDAVPGIVQPYSINGYDGDDYLDCRCSHCDAAVEYEQRYCNGCGRKLIWEGDPQ